MPIAFQAANPDRAVAVSEFDRGGIIGPEHDLSDPDLIGRVNDNGTDFRNALSTGPYQQSDKNPIRHKQQASRKPTPTPTQSANLDDQ